MNDSPLPPYVDEKYLRWHTQEALETFAGIMGGEVGDVEKRITQKQDEEVAGLRAEIAAMRERYDAMIDALQSQVDMLADDLADTDRSAKIAKLRTRDAA